MQKLSPGIEFIFRKLPFLHKSIGKLQRFKAGFLPSSEKHSGYPGVFLKSDRNFGVKNSPPAMESGWAMGLHAFNFYLRMRPAPKSKKAFIYPALLLQFGR